jgi:hypothetical protein
MAVSTNATHGAVPGLVDMLDAMVVSMNATRNETDADAMEPPASVPLKETLIISGVFGALWVCYYVFLCICAYVARGAGRKETGVLRQRRDLLRVVPWDANRSAATECAVCLETYASGDLVRELPCRHTFHAACIDRWWDHLPQELPRCPLCKGLSLPEGRPKRTAEGPKRATEITRFAPPFVSAMSA